MKNPLIVMFDAVGKERVKGISFHPRRPWILASDGQGDVELWDYRLQVLIHHYKGAHAGPVRAVQFHATQPIFVTCGDDHLVKVWNYQQHKCVFVLHGHSDYVRSVAFHHEYPWIASGSDDNLVKIWNWQSRTCIATLPGHASYVMCVRFHPVSDLLASASLDGTVRIWNFSSLAQEQLGRCASNNGPRVGAGVPFGVRDFTAPGGERPLLQPIQCHTPSRLNFVAFHPTKPLFVTAADDSDVRLWQLNGDSVRHVDAFVGHTKHATAAVFHPTRDLIVSCAEDASVRVWESDRSAQPIVVQRDNNKCWIVDVHPTQHIFAVGHEKGFFVFKLSHDRPAFCTDTVLTKATATAPATASVTTYLYREGKIFESSSTAPGQERAVATVRSLSRPENPALAPRGLQYNAANRNQQCFLLLNPDNTYELHISAPAGQAPLAPLKGYAKSAVFVSSTRFVTLDKNRTVLLKSLKNEVKRRIVVPGAHQLFPAGIGRVLVRCSDSVLLLDVHALRPIAELPLSARHPIEHAVWSPDQRHVALWSRTHVYVATAKLELVAQASESARVKSAAWDPTGVLIYCTSSQLKYLLPSGDKGVLRSVDEPVYLTSANNAEVSFLTRLQKPGRLTVNSVEYQFKLALLRHRSKDVARLMQSKLLIGQSIVAYVQRKGYPEIAMHFVHDVRLRFALALECGNVEIAKEAASEINETACWQQLGSEALRHGAYDVAEGAFFRARDFQRLTFLYLILGDSAKLQQLSGIALSRGNVMGGFHSALLLGDVSARIAILRGSGQPHLAYAAAVAHGLTEAAEEIAVQLARDIEAHHTAQQQAREEVAAGEAAPRPALPAPLPAPDMRSPQSHLLSVAEVTAAIAAGQAYGAALTPAGARTAASRGVFTPPTVVVEAAAHLQVPQPALPLVRPAAPTAPALLIPPPRVWPLAGPWPRLAVRRGFDFTREGTESDDRERAEQEEQERLDAERAARAEEELDMGWDSGSSAAATSSSAAAGAGASAAASPAAAGGGDWDLNIDLGDELNDVDDAPAAVPAAAAPAGGAYGFVMPEAGRPAVAGWTAAALPGALIAAGAFEQAMHVLNQHYGICNFAPFKPMFVQGALLSSAQAPLLPWLPSQPAPLTSSFDARYSPQGYPPVVVSAPVARFTPACAAELQREMLASMTAGNFPAVAQLAQTVILQTPMMLLGSEQEQTAALEGLATAREYALALKLDAARNAAADAGRKAELAAYATHCAVAPVHAVLMLWIACKYMLAVKNYRTIALLCRRILDLAGASDMSSLQGKVDFEMVRKMLKKCETQGADTTQLRYDPSVLFAVCATTLVPIPGTKAAEGRDVVVCGLCGAKHAMAHQGQICTVCNVSKLGAPASGPRLFVASKA